MDVDIGLDNYPNYINHKIKYTFTVRKFKNHIENNEQQWIMMEFYLDKASLLDKYKFILFLDNSGNIPYNVSPETFDFKVTMSNNYYCVFDQHMVQKQGYYCDLLVSRKINLGFRALIGAAEQDIELNIDLVQEEDYGSDDKPNFYETQQYLEEGIGSSDKGYYGYGYGYANFPDDNAPFGGQEVNSIEGEKC